MQAVQHARTSCSGPTARLRPLRPSTERLHAPLLRGCTLCRAAASQGPDAGFNPFRNRKEDQAKRALQQMFGDKPDSLAANDLPPGGRPPGKKGTGGDGGGEESGKGFGLPEVRAWVIGLFSSVSGFAKFCAAIAAMGLALWSLPYIGPILAAVRDLIGTVFRFVLRLDPRPPRQKQLALPPELLEELGPAERSMIAKYG